MHTAQPQGHHGKTAAKKHRSDSHANGKSFAKKSPGAKSSRGSRLDKIKI
jgi:hypothetical protein